MADYTSSHTGAAIDAALDDIEDMVGTGSSKNITSTGILKIGANPSAGGQINVNNGGWFKGRNAADSADISIIRIDSSNDIQIGDGAKVKLNGDLLVSGGDIILEASRKLLLGGTIATYFQEYALDNVALVVGGVPVLDANSSTVSVTGSDFSVSDGNLTVNTSANENVYTAAATHATFASATLRCLANRAATGSCSFLQGFSSGGADLEFDLSGAGNGTCDGAWTGGGADYAEWFEWADGNPNDDDRVGYSVTMIGNKVALAVDGDVVMGVVSAMPAMVGDGDIGRWKEKYLTDDFGRYIMEPYEQEEWIEILEAEEAEILDDDGEVTRPFKAAKVKKHSFQSDKIPEGIAKGPGAKKISLDEKSNPLMRRKLNPAHIEGDEYVPRADRKEWSTIGLVGKLRLRDGQPVDGRWVKMRDISKTVSEWLVR